MKLCLDLFSDFVYSQIVTVWAFEHAQHSSSDSIRKYFIRGRHCDTILSFMYLWHMVQVIECKAENKVAYSISRCCEAAATSGSQLTLCN